MRLSMRQIIAAWACCGLMGLGALLVEGRGDPVSAVFAGVHIPSRGGSTASALSIEDEFGEDVTDNVSVVSNRGEPFPYSRREVAESQRCWLRSFRWRLL